MEPILARGDFIDGAFVRATPPDDEIAQPSPADLSDTPGTFPVDSGHIDRAVEAARRAQRAWEQAGLEARANLLQKFKTELKAREPEFVAMLGREIGKPPWEAKGEVAALLSKIDITLKEGLALVRDFELDGGKLACRYRPHGVLGVIGPFNFPLHLPHGHIVPALATGNTVVFKPSDVAPGCAQIYAEAAHASGFPPGVLNVVQGKGPAGAMLASHANIDGILFTGSYRTGCAIIRANADRPGRMLALELGGKNTAIVLADAPWEKTLYDVLFSAFATAGQRCTAVSRVVVERPIAERFMKELVDKASRIVVGHPADAGVFMGPVATRASLEKFQAAQTAARSEGADILLESRAPTMRSRGWYATPSVHRPAQLDSKSEYQSEEIFGPDLAVYVADDLEEACRIADATPYGLAASVFTADRGKFDGCASRLHVGCLGWNAPTVGSSSRLPFGGVRNSGNQRPAALFSTLYCVYPVAVTAGSPTLESAALAPGIPWN
jgi:succinylglutamic semialdehyde dehydrogenase